MEPQAFLFEYLQGIPDGAPRCNHPHDHDWSDFVLEERCYINPSDLERYVYSLSRSELLRLIDDLHIADNQQALTKKQLIYYVDNLRNTIEKNIIDIENLAAMLHRIEQEVISKNAQYKQGIDELQNIAECALYQLRTMENSTSWKMTLPLRILFLQARKILGFCTAPRK